MQPTLLGASLVSSRKGCPTTMEGGLWVCRCFLGTGSAGSAGVKESLLWGCVLVMGADSTVILFAGRRPPVFRWDSLLFPKAYWRIRYKR